MSWHTRWWPPFSSVVFFANGSHSQRPVRRRTVATHLEGCVRVRRRRSLLCWRSGGHSALREGVVCLVFCSLIPDSGWVCQHAMDDSIAPRLSLKRFDPLVLSVTNLFVSWLSSCLRRHVIEIRLSLSRFCFRDRYWFDVDTTVSQYNAQLC